MIKLLNMDNMDLMAKYDDNHFDLAIVDPPYGLGNRLVSGGQSKGWANRVNSDADKWDIKPRKEYFDELFRVAKNQIIWGGNHFNLKESRGIISWDKVKDHDRNSSHWEYAWTSFDVIARMFRFCNNGGFIAKEKKIHPTQKPVKLYEWLLMNYAKEGDNILDTHLGSGSIAIACHNYGFDLAGCEIDKEYYDQTMIRYNNHIAQQNLFIYND